MSALSRPDLITSLKAMIEQAGVPEHDARRCGSNDCPACEWLAIAESIGWPLWGIPHEFEGDPEQQEGICGNCGNFPSYELHVAGRAGRELTP